jgi:hypothetical protein
MSMMFIIMCLVFGVVGCGVAILALFETSRNAREIKNLKSKIDTTGK